MSIVLDNQSANELRKIALSAYNRLLKLKEDYVQEFRDKFNVPAERIVDDWYDSYDPRMYKRHGANGTAGLYTAYKLDIKDFPPSLEYGPELMEGNYHQGAAFVYENSFMLGWHGGSFGEEDEDGVSPTKEAPQWRKYNPKVAKTYGEPPYQHWYGMTAPWSDPPGPHIIALYDKVFSEVDNKYGKRAEEIVRVFMRDVRSVLKKKGGA